MHRLFILVFFLATAAGAVEPDVATLRAEAAAGDAYAQLNLGAAYDNGIGTEPDTALALYWYRAAADQGVPEAQFNLGHLLVSRGETAEGARWLTRAAEQGLADAQYLIGVMLAEGSAGVPVDREAAVTWLRRAAAQEHAEAQAYLEAGFPDALH
ncbi:MAG: tetratricopeptide repeat protein [Thiohalomonadaceae bacterium]